MHRARREPLFGMFLIIPINICSLMERAGTFSKNNPLNTNGYSTFLLRQKCNVALKMGTSLLLFYKLGRRLERDAN